MAGVAEAFGRYCQSDGVAEPLSMAVDERLSNDNQELVCGSRKNRTPVDRWFAGRSMSQTVFLRERL